MTPSTASTAAAMVAAPPPSPAQLAKGALRRLAVSQLEPTPENYARAYAEEAGGSAPRAAQPRPDNAPQARSTHPAAAWPALLERLVRNLERGGKQWTAARRKESLHRVIDGSRSDEVRLTQRLLALLQAWEHDRPADGTPSHEATDAGEAPTAHAAPRAAAKDDAGFVSGTPPRRVIDAYHQAVGAGLAAPEELAADIARRLSQRVDLATAQAAAGAASAIDEWLAACSEARRWFEQRHEIVRQLESLCAEMAQGLVELAEDASFSRGQCEALRVQLQGPLELRRLRAASTLLADTRARQGVVRRERESARVALKELLSGMITEVGALQQHTGGFESALERHAVAVQSADSLEALASVVQAMLADSRGVRAAVADSSERLRSSSSRAAAMEARVQQLEVELRRLSDEASTDALTQVANRRGLERLFADECALAERTGAPLAVGLLDIDNFKKLNDRLGHAAGDTALKALAAAVRERLRPEDQVARFGGEEFVVLLRGLAVEPAREALSRLQRSLTASLFLHESEEVFVTFSAGVTQWRRGEALETVIERADVGLYEAKRTGKNRTCAG